MKSIEDIDRRLEEVSKAPDSFEKSVTMDYLSIAKKCYNEEYWLRHLLNRYSYEVKEDAVIVETLKWVLDIDNK